jgi:hypothetical protein
MNSWGSSGPDTSPFAGPFFAGELALAPAQPEPKGRVSKRVSVTLGAGLRQRGASGVTIQVVDLSTHGFRAATHLELEVGTDVWLRLPGLESCHATVAWSKGHLIGCAFERPLHPAVLDMVVRKSAGR